MSSAGALGGILSSSCGHQPAPGPGRPPDEASASGEPGRCSGPAHRVSGVPLQRHRRPLSGRPPACEESGALLDDPGVPCGRVARGSVRNRSRLLRNHRRVEGRCRPRHLRNPDCHRLGRLRWSGGLDPDPCRGRNQLTATNHPGWLTRASRQGLVDRNSSVSPADADPEQPPARGGRDHGCPHGHSRALRGDGEDVFQSGLGCWSRPTGRIWPAPTPILRPVRTSRNPRAPGRPGAARQRCRSPETGGGATGRRRAT